MTQFKQTLLYGKGVQSLSDSDVPLSAWEVVAELRHHFSSPDYRPPTLPAVATELHALAHQADVPMGKVVALLEKDDMLAARILRVAQSPMYTSGTPIHSLNDAVVRLGLRTVRDIVWALALNMRIFKGNQYLHVMESVHNHSIVTAHLSRMVAEHTSIVDEYAFLSGLLHDVGVSASLAVLSERKNKSQQLDQSMLGYVIDDIHEEAGGLIAKLWSLPHDLQFVLQSHHKLKFQGYVHPVSALVCIAQQLAVNLGANIHINEESVCDTTDPQILTLAYETLNIGNKERGAIESEAEDIYAQVADLT